MSLGLWKGENVTQKSTFQEKILFLNFLYKKGWSKQKNGMEEKQYLHESLSIICKT